MKQIYKWLTLIPILFYIYYYSGMVYSGDRAFYYLGSFQGSMMVDAILNHLPIAAFVIWDLFKHKVVDFKQMCVTGCLYLYLFFIYINTISYLPFHHFIENQVVIDTTSVIRYNLTPFKSIIETDITNLHNYGNFLMLVPLGILLPLKYPNLKKSHILGISFLLILAIESTQLIFTFVDSKFTLYGYDRSFDIDDFIRNFLGAVIGLMIYRNILSPLFLLLKRWVTSNFQTREEGMR